MPELWAEYDVDTGSVYWVGSQQQVAKTAHERNAIFQKYDIPKVSAVRVFVTTGGGRS